MSYSQYKICRICSSYMREHEVMEKFLKCPTCGFTKIAPIITIEAYLMGRDKTYKDEYSQDIFNNASILLEKINLLLNELGIKEAKVSSGWRPPSLNGTVANAAKKSAHQTGEACDILDDKDQSLAKKCTKEILEKYDLYREDSDSTKGQNTNWVHLQTRKTSSGNRIFKP